MWVGHDHAGLVFYPKDREGFHTGWGKGHCPKCIIGSSLCLQCSEWTKEGYEMWQGEMVLVKAQVVAVRWI